MGCSVVLVGCITSSSRPTALSRRCRLVADTQACREWSPWEEGCAPFRLPAESRTCSRTESEQAGRRAGGSTVSGSQPPGIRTGRQAGRQTCACPTVIDTAVCGAWRPGIPAPRFSPPFLPHTPQSWRPRPFVCAALWHRRAPAPARQNCTEHPAREGSGGMAVAAAATCWVHSGCCPPHTVASG